MSQTKKIAKNIQRNNIEFMNKNNYDAILGGMARNGLTLQDLAREVDKTRRETRERTYIATCKVLYASMAIVLKEEFGFSKEDCFKAMNDIDHKMSLAIDNEEIIKEMEDKTKIQFNSENGVERIQML